MFIDQMLVKGKYMQVLLIVLCIKIFYELKINVVDFFDDFRKNFAYKQEFGHGQMSHDIFLFVHVVVEWYRCSQSKTGIQ